MEQKLKKSILYTFGVGDGGFSMMVLMEVFFFGAFLTDFAKFSLPVTGQILGITSILDVLCALLAGVVVQKATLKFGGKYRSWFIAGPLFIAILYVLQFTKIGSEQSAAAIIIVGFVSSHLLWNVVYSAHLSMINKLTKNPDERTMLAINKGQWANGAGLIFSYIAMPIVMMIGAATNSVAGFTYTVAIFSMLYVLSYLYLYGLTKGKDPDEVADTTGKGPKQSVGEIIGLVFKNPPLLLILLAELFRNAATSILMAFGFYYFKYVLNDLGFLSIYLSITMVTAFIGTLLGAPIGIKLGARNAYIVFNFASVALLIVALLFGNSTLSFSIIMGINGITNGILFGLPGAMLSDTIVYGEWKTGKNISGLTMGLINVPIKLGIFIKSMAMSVGLMAIGFVADAPVIEQGVKMGITNIITLLPAIMTAICAVIILFGYKLSKDKIVTMMNEIEARKSNESAKG